MSIYHWLPSMIVIQLRNIKLNHSADGTLTNRAKLRVSVCFHATVVGRTVNTFGGIAASFIYSYRIFLSFSNRVGIGVSDGSISSIWKQSSPVLKYSVPTVRHPVDKYPSSHHPHKNTRRPIHRSCARIRALPPV